MQAASELRMPMSKVARNMKLQVRITLTGKRLFAVRQWCAVQLLKLAAAAFGCELEISLAGRRVPADRPSLDVPPEHLSVLDLAGVDRPVTWDEARRIQVMLDGVECKDVIAYDCAAGWVERLRKYDGEFVVRDRELVRDRLSGQVTAEYRREAA